MTFSHPPSFVTKINPSPYLFPGLPIPSPLPSSVFLFLSRRKYSTHSGQKQSGSHSIVPPQWIVLTFMLKEKKNHQLLNIKHSLIFSSLIHLDVGRGQPSRIAEFPSPKTNRVGICIRNISPGRDPLRQAMMTSTCVSLLFFNSEPLSIKDWSTPKGDIRRSYKHNS